MFIAFILNSCRAPAERHVLWRFTLHAAPNGAGKSGVAGYKHVAPPEQKPLNIGARIALLFSTFGDFPIFPVE